METRPQYRTAAKDEATHRFLLRLPETMYEWFRSEAAKQNRSVNAEINLALEAWRKIREMT